MNTKLVFSRYIWFLLGILLAGSFFLPGHYDIPYPQIPGPVFDPIVKKEYVNAMSENKPEMVLVGDSVLYFGVDQQKLTEQLGMEAYNIGVPGSASAVWYLILKNMIFETEPHPKYVVILFRDTMLTLPAFRTTGRYFELLDDFARPREPLVKELAFVNQMNPIEKLAEQYFPLYSARWEMRDGLDSRIRYTAASMFINCPASCTDDALNSVFGKQGVDIVALNRAVTDSQQTLYTAKALNFKEQIDESFLPAMIQLAHKNNVTLIFVRTKTLIYPEYKSETPALSNYINLLNTYLSGYDNIILLDLAHDERIEASYFSDLLHLNAEGKEIFTQILADELKLRLRLKNQ